MGSCVHPQQGLWWHLEAGEELAKCHLPSQTGGEAAEPLRPRASGHHTPGWWVLAGVKEPTPEKGRLLEGTVHPEHSSSAAHLPVPTCSRLATVCRNSRGKRSPPLPPEMPQMSVAGQRICLRAPPPPAPPQEQPLLRWAEQGTWCDAVGPLLYEQSICGKPPSLKHHQMTDRRDAEFNRMLPVVQRKG